MFACHLQQHVQVDVITAEHAKDQTNAGVLTDGQEQTADKVSIFQETLIIKHKENHKRK